MKEANPRFNNSGALWYQDRGRDTPRFKGQVQIDGVVYALEGRSRDQFDSSSDKAPTIKLTARVKDDY